MRPAYSLMENIITVGDERLCCAEVLFQPSFIGEEASDTSFQDITKCDVDLRQNLCAMTCSLTSVKVPSMDWRIFLVLTLLPADVDFEGEYDESRSSSSTVVFAHLRATVVFIHVELFLSLFYWLTVTHCTVTSL